MRVRVTLFLIISLILLTVFSVSAGEHFQVSPNAKTYTSEPAASAANCEWVPNSQTVTIGATTSTGSPCPSSGAGGTILKYSGGWTWYKDFGTTYNVGGSTTIGTSATSTYWLFQDGYFGSWYACYMTNGTAPPTTPVAAFSANVTSGYAPLSVLFTDASTQTPTSWSWSFGDDGTSTLQNPSHTFSSAGSYTVSLTATNSYGSDEEIKVGYINVSTLLPPVASCTITDDEVEAPAQITFTDTSTYSPTSFSYQIYDSFNDVYYTSTSRNVTIWFNTSGTFDVYHQATNSAGSDDVWYYDAINVIGVAPTPTQTPDIPWPNQTGICRGASITLGSNDIQSYDRHYQLTDPEGDTYSGYYQGGSVTSVIYGQPFFTAINGQYIYQEYNMVTGGLTYRSSYVVETCVTPVPTTLIPISPTYTAPITIIPTYTVIPTITVAPSISSTWTIPVTITQVPTIPLTWGPQPTINITDIRDDIDPLFNPVLELVDSIMWPFFNFTISIIATAFSPILLIVNYGTWAISSFTVYVSAFNDVLGFMGYVITELVSTMPNKFINTITICLWLDIIEQIWWLKGTKV